MTPTTEWLERLLAVAVALTVLFAGVTSFSDDRSPGRELVRARASALDGKLRLLRWKMTGMRIVGWQAGVVVACLILGALGRWPALVLIPPVAFSPTLLLDQRIQQRIAKIEEQIEPWLLAIANALRASPSLGEAIASSSSLVASPMNEEVDVLIKEYELGTPLDQALDNMTARIGSRTLSGAVLALKVARKSGGDLAETLTNAAAALRELARLEGVVRAKTAEGKAQAFVIGIVPAPLVLAIHWMDPEFFKPLAATFTGNLVVAGAAALWAVAILASKKILAVDV